MTVRVTTSGAERMRTKAQKRLSNLQGGAVNKALNASGRDLIALYRARIESFIPGTVPDLKEQTKKTKQKQVGFVYPILRRTGQLVASMYHRVSMTESVATIRVGFRGRRAGGTLNSVIAGAHLDGTATLPKRDFTRVTSEWRRSIMARLRKAIG